MKKRPKGWIGTPRHRQQAAAAISGWNNHQRENGVRCGARRKYDGEPCQRYAMENGRCHFHGGKTPAGDRGWHKPRWPDKNAPDAMRKLNQKLIAREKAARRRERRLANMTPEQRAKHEQWHRTHQPGDPAKRKALRLEREQNQEAIALLQLEPQQKPHSAEYQAIVDRIAELKAKQLKVSEEAEQTNYPNVGVFK